MQLELARAGIRAPVLRAFWWAGLIWLASLLLPVRVEVGGPVWSYDLLGYSAGNAAVGASLFAGVGLLLLARLSDLPCPSRAWMGLTASAAALAALLGDPDAHASLLPFLPSALSRGYVALVLAVSAAALGLRADRRGPATLLLAAAAGATAYLYLWPHPFGALSETALESTAAVLSPGPGRARAALATHTALAALPAMLVLIAASVRAFGTRESARVVAGWVIAALPATLIALSIKGATQLGADAYVLVGLRAAGLVLALLLTTTFAIETAFGALPVRASMGQRLVGHGLGLAALLITLVPHVHRPEAQIWATQTAPAWATELYEEALPRVAIAAGSVDLPGGQIALTHAVQDAAALAAPVPEVGRLIEDLGRLAQSPGRHRRSLERLGDKLNRAARQSKLPFYADLQVTSYSRSAGQMGWLMYLKTYEIEQSHLFALPEGIRSTLWLRRLDRTNVSDARLGWTRHDAPEGMVMLDVVQDHWRQDLAPSLAGIAGRGARTRVYARHAVTLTKDLARALEPHGVAPAQLGALLGCIARGSGVYRPRKSYCGDVRRLVEPRVLRVLAEKIEAHELQHVVDGSRLAPPTALLGSMEGYSEQSVRFASAELSAYLGEVARSPVPRVALAHFLALADAHPKSPEGFAGRVAMQTLTAQTGLPPHVLLRQDSLVVSDAARQAYRSLFGVPLAVPVRIDLADDLTDEHPGDDAV